MSAPAFRSTLTPPLAALLAVHGWAPGHILFHCIDCGPDANERRARGELGAGAPGTRRCREHALEAALTEMAGRFVAAMKAGQGAAP